MHEKNEAPTSETVENKELNQEPKGENNMDNENLEKPAPRQRRRDTQTEPPAPVLTLEVGADVETQQDKENAVWHEIKTSQMTGTHLTGILGKVELRENGGLISVVDYKGQRIAIPLEEMMLGLTPSKKQSEEVFNERMARVLNRMMGAEIDFIVRGVTGKRRRSGCGCKP